MFRGDPTTTEEHIAYIYELLRRLRPPFLVQTILQEDGGTGGTGCPCPVNVRTCVIPSEYDAGYDSGYDAGDLGGGERVYINGAEGGTQFQFDRWGGISPRSQSQDVSLPDSCSARAQSAHYYGNLYSIVSPGLTKFYQRDTVTPSADAWADTLGRVHGWGTSDAGLSMPIFIHAGNDSSANLYINGVLVASSAAGVLTASMMTIEYYVEIADAGGRFVMRIDGVDVIDYTGDTNPSITAVTYFMHWGYKDSGGPSLCHDDIVITDATGIGEGNWLGPGTVAGFFPNGMGTGTNNLTGTPEATDRHLNINDITAAGAVDCISTVDNDPTTDTSYNSSSTNGAYDLYTFDFSSVGTFRSIALWARVLTSGSGQYKFVYKLNGTEYRSGTFTANAGAYDGTGRYGYLVLDTNPDTGLPWAVGDLDGMEIGIECVGNNNIQLEQLLVEVEGSTNEVCSPPPPPPEPCLLDPTDDVLLVDATAADGEVLLPLVQNGRNHIFYVKRIDDTDHVVTLVTDDGATIDLQPSYDLNGLDGVLLVSDEESWWVLADISGSIAQSLLHNILSSTHSDVDFSDVPADGDVLKWDAALGQWIADACDCAGGYDGGGDATGIVLSQGKSYTLSPAPNASYPDLAIDQSRAASTAFSTRGGKLTDGEHGAMDTFLTWYCGWQADPVIRLDMDAAVSGSLFRVWGMWGTDIIYRPIAAKLEYSDDDSSWTTVEDRTGLTEGTAGTRHYWMTEFDISASGSHRYWRVTLTHSSTGGAWIFVSEVEFIS